MIYFQEMIIRRNDGENDTKYQFSNAPVETSIEKLGKMSCSRDWIERLLEDAKGDGGLADYEIFEVIMPKRHVSDREILKLIEKKHKA